MVAEFVPWRIGFSGIARLTLPHQNMELQYLQANVWLESSDLSGTYLRVLKAAQAQAAGRRSDARLMRIYFCRGSGDGWPWDARESGEMPEFEMFGVLEIWKTGITASPHKASEAGRC